MPDLRTDRINVHNGGYVRLVAAMPDGDLSVVNAARVSFAKESEELSDRDVRLIKYLVDHQHSSPFRHSFLTLEIKAPLMVARQWWKHVVGGEHTEATGWNEVSRRYVSSEPEFYLPYQWFRAPTDRKQGSGGFISPEENKWITEQVVEHYDRCLIQYQELLDFGVAPEQARLVLPAYALYTSWRWSCSLQAIAYFLKLRLQDDAQSEMRAYAAAVYQLVAPLFPVSFDAMNVNRGIA